MRPNPIIAFTGHRPPKIGGYGDTLERAHIKTALSQTILHILKTAHESDVITFYSGMAQGVDQDAAEIVLRQRSVDARIRLVAYLPCLHQERPWPHDKQVLYRAMVDQCDAVVRVSGDDYTPRCMMDRNIAMVDKAHYLVAVYDGSSGGTRNTVEYAKSRAVPVMTLNPKAIWATGIQSYAAMLREVFQ